MPPARSRSWRPAEPQRLDALSAQLGGALSVQTDVTDADQVVVLVAAELDRHGRIDALVNNAGVSLHDETIEQLDLDQFHRVLDLNVVSVIRLMQCRAGWCLVRPGRTGWPAALRCLRSDLLRGLSTGRLR